MPAKASESEDLDHRSIIITRVLSAPRERAFDAWTSRDALARWFGPNGFSITTRAFDFRPDGSWRFVMHAPDGTDYQNLITYDEIVRPDRIVYRHGEPGADPATHFQTTITFAGLGNRTEITLRAVFPTAEARDRSARDHHAVEGGQQTLARLDAELGDAASADTDLVIERTLNAPRDLVWKAHTEADRLAKWWGPKGFEMLACNIDLRPGGQAPNGVEMWGRLAFREITPQTRLAYVASFSNPAGGVTRHFMSNTWPLELLSILSFSESGGRTILTMRGTPINATPEEIATFTGAKTNVQQGFKGTYDQLDAYLASL